MKNLIAIALWTIILAFAALAQSDKGRYTTTWVFRDGRWLIAADHSSDSRTKALVTFTSVSIALRKNRDLFAKQVDDCYDFNSSSTQE
jgi:hypothetical protein